MKAYVGIGLLVVAAAGAALLTSALAQEAGQPIMGTVTMYDGRTFTGEIKQAAFGIYEGVGIEKTADGGRGSFILEVDGAQKVIDGLDVAQVEIVWQEPADATAQWTIETMTITTKGGEAIVGKPTWRLAASLLEIAGTRETEPVSIKAYPISPTTFRPENLMVKIEIAGAEVGPEPGEVGPPPPPGPGPIPPEVGPGPGAPPVAPTVDVGEPVAVTLTLRCPNCGEPISVQIDAHAR